MKRVFKMCGTITVFFYGDVWEREDSICKHTDNLLDKRERDKEGVRTKIRRKG